jgi:two-component sensor histidine kinase
MVHKVEVGEINNPTGVVDLAGKLAQIQAVAKSGDAIHLEFGDHFVYMSGLVMIAAWRKYLGRNIGVIIDDTKCKESARRLIINSGFKSIVEDNVETADYARNISTRVPLQPIVPGYSTEAAISKVCKIVEELAGDLGEDQPFKTVLSELVENALVHGQIENLGYISAALYRSANAERLEVCIVDTGIGIKSSYLEGSNESVKSRIRNGACPVEIALDGLTSSKPQAPTPGGRSHFGLGLFTVRRLVERNRGLLTVLSNTDAVTYDWRGKTRRPVKHDWHGTIVSMILDLTSPLSLEAVYEEAAAMILPDQKDTDNTDQHKASADGKIQGSRTTEKTLLKLSEFGKELLARETGLAIRAEAGLLLASADRIIVELDGVEDITPSVADEAFGKLAERLGFENFQRRVCFEGGTPLIHRLLDFVITQRARASAATNT